MKNAVGEKSDEQVIEYVHASQNRMGQNHMAQDHMAQDNMVSAKHPSHTIPTVCGVWKKRNLFGSFKAH
ncbi:hypothetical protein GCM10007877_09790 [Marinibactrum halimedae]|uniref:Uncharacterized protein n=1 Tax=Marinibactrum halimedae TaxID=1444977 RepID=A0AA37WLP8_9GAMM|nr:hypothetical protein GCM10007877_09790 [Marinibactrum halimedae]